MGRLSYFQYSKGGKLIDQIGAQNIKDNLQLAEVFSILQEMNSYSIFLYFDALFNLSASSDNSDT